MPQRDYLAVDDFLKTQLDAKSLDFALRSGLIDQLWAGDCSLDQLPIRNEAGRRLLLDLLASNHVIQINREHASLTPGFRHALAFRELLEEKIAFAEEAAKDVTHFFPLLIDNLPGFMTNSATFGLFRYDRCFQATPDNLEATRKWVRYTTALTRHEGQVLAERLAGHPGSQGWERALDLGGNSGELALQLCAAFPALHVTVFDLPVVCEIGKEHTRGRHGSERVRFQQGDMRRDSLPASQDAVIFKSVLHDWPEADAREILTKAAGSLRPGGRLVIFERGPLQAAQGLTYAQYTNLVFFHFFRPAAFYLDVLASLPFSKVSCETIALDMDFHLIVAQRNI